MGVKYYRIRENLKNELFNELTIEGRLTNRQIKDVIYVKGDLTILRWAKWLNPEQTKRYLVDVNNADEECVDYNEEHNDEEATQSDEEYQTTIYDNVTNDEDVEESSIADDVTNFMDSLGI